MPQYFDPIVDGTQGTDSEFTHDWVDEHLSDEVKDSLFWDICNWLVGELIDDANARYFGDKTTNWFTEGRMGGWLVCHSFTKDEVLETWTVPELNAWRSFETHVHQVRDDFWHEWLQIVYLNFFTPWKEAQIAGGPKPRFIPHDDMFGKKKFWLGPFDEEVDLNNLEEFTNMIRRHFDWPNVKKAGDADSETTTE